MKNLNFNFKRETITYKFRYAPKISRISPVYSGRIYPAETTMASNDAQNKSCTYFWGGKISRASLPGVIS